MKYGKLSNKDNLKKLIEAGKTPMSEDIDKLLSEVAKLDAQISCLQQRREELIDQVVNMFDGVLSW